MSAWVSLPKQWVRTTWNKQTSTLHWNRPRSEKLLRFNWTGLYLNCRDYFVGGIGIMSIMLFEFRLQDLFVLQTFSETIYASWSRKEEISYRLHLHLCLTQSLAVEVLESRSFSINFMRLALVVFWPSASLAGLMSSIDSSSFNHYCPRRVLVQTAKTRGGTLGAPAYREENFAVPEKVSIFENTARKGLPKVRWGSNKQAKDSGSVLYTTRFWILHFAR